MTYRTTTAEFFESMYLANPDPWNFKHRAYEQARYAATLDALRHRFYQDAFEPGCSIGVLTQALARFCDHVEALDISPTAVAQARKRCRELRNVSVSCGALPDAIPQLRFDLIVFSEIGYYFDENDLTELTTQLVGRLRMGGTLVAVHWLGVSVDHLLSGDHVHEIICSNPQLSLEEQRLFPSFRLDRLVRK